MTNNMAHLMRELSTVVERERERGGRERGGIVVEGYSNNDLFLAIQRPPYLEFPGCFPFIFYTYGHIKP